MKYITFVILILLFFAGCRRLLFSEYRNKDYYLIKGGQHYFYDKKLKFDKAVLQEVYKATKYDTCSCITVVNDVSKFDYFNQLVIGFQLNLKIYSRDWYSAFPHDGSVEAIESICIFIKNKNQTIEISKYLSNQSEIRDNLIFSGIDSSRNFSGKGIYFNAQTKCYKGFSVKSLTDFENKFNLKRFDDGLNTVDWYTFLFPVMEECPYKIKDFDEIETVIKLKTKNTKRTIRFHTDLK